MKSRRRGAAINVIVPLMSAAQMVAIGGLAGSVDETDQGVRRVLMVRACYAADAARLMMAVQARRGLIVPPAGEDWSIGSTTVTVVSAPTPSSGGKAVVAAKTRSAKKPMSGRTGRKRLITAPGRSGPARVKDRTDR